MKHFPKIIVWGAISVKGTARLFFVSSETTINGLKYLELLNNKLELYMNVHQCTIIMQESKDCKQLFKKWKNLGS